MKNRKIYFGLLLCIALGLLIIGKTEQAYADPGSNSLPGGTISNKKGEGSRLGALPRVSPSGGLTVGQVEDILHQGAVRQSEEASRRNDQRLQELLTQVDQLRSDQGRSSGRFQDQLGQLSSQLEQLSIGPITPEARTLPVVESVPLSESVLATPSLDQYSEVEEVSRLLSEIAQLEERGDTEGLARIGELRRNLASMSVDERGLIRSASEVGFPDQ